MQVTFLGHSAVSLVAGGHEVLIDPFLTGNPVATVAPGALAPHTIVITHAHADHVGDAVEIASRSGATIVSSVEVVGRLRRDADPEAARGWIGANIGGRVRFAAGTLRFTPAWHSSSFSDGTYGGMPMGVVLEFGGRRVYHAGDTGLFGDMALIGRRGLDLALLPIGGHYTMDPDEAVEAVRLLRPKTVVPIHFGTFGLIEQDPAAFATAVAALGDDAGGSVVRVLAPGEALDL